MTPGIKTSEGWLTMLAQAFGFLVILGVLTPEESNEVVRLVEVIAGAAIQLVPLVVYIYNRTGLKKHLMSVIDLIDGDEADT